MYRCATQTAVQMFEVAWRLSKDTSALLWLSAIGLSEQFLSHKLNRARYLLATQQLNIHATRLSLS